MRYLKGEACFSGPWQVVESTGVVISAERTEANARKAAKTLTDHERRNGRSTTYSVKALVERLITDAEEIQTENRKAENKDDRIYSVARPDDTPGKFWKRLFLTQDGQWSRYPSNAATYTSRLEANSAAVTAGKDAAAVPAPAIRARAAVPAPVHPLLNPTTYRAKRL
jgi:hypothetical protein